jgi:very-short-patch-repair endonuclease
VAFGPYELDLFWPEEGVAIEIDGREHHSSRPRFEGDRRKDNWLRARDATATAVQVGQILGLCSESESHLAADSPAAIAIRI